MYNCTNRPKTITYPQQPKTEGQKLSSWFRGFFSDRRVVPYLLSYHCYRAVKVILKVMPITEPGQAFRAPLRPITLVT